MENRDTGPVPGRVYVLGQVLAREHDRNLALQKEIERLRADMAQLRQHESELRAALDRAGASTAAPVGAQLSTPDKIAQPTAEAVTSAARELAAAEERRHHDAEAQSAAAIGELRATLTREQQRRQEVETQLARLKEETSAPPYTKPDASSAELAAAKQEVAQLRATLDDERAARERLARDFRALQQRAATENAAAPTAATEDTELRARLQQLEQEKQTLTQSFNRSLGESQQRAADLEQQLAQTRDPSVVAALDGNVTSIRAENTALRTRLDEEHRHTEELAAKLKVAMRVTDLIFKMQAQQAQPRY